MYIRQKIFIGGILSILLMGFASSAMATRMRVTGVPVNVQANSPTSYWKDGFDVSGVTSMGTCPLDSNGFVAADIARPVTTSSTDPSGSRLWALVLAAELAGKPVTVLLDDTNKDAQGNCIAIWIFM